MIDSHCHLFDKKYELTPQEIADRFFGAGGKALINVACDEAVFGDAIEFSKQNKRVYYSLGYHPEYALNYDLNVLENLLKTNDKKLVAVGEIGLDYYWDKTNAAQQKVLFDAQIKLAQKYDLPIIVHSRDAAADTLEILKANAPYKNPGVIHCFSGSFEWGKEILKLGFYISFSGSVTYKNAKNLHEAAIETPIDKILIETDSPYLTPSNCERGINEPKNVKEVGNFIADLRKMNRQLFIEICAENTVKLFKKIAT